MPAPPAGLRQVSPEVVYSDAALVVADAPTLELLRELATRSPKGRARLCAHPDPASPQQEMLIVMRSGGYVRPHRHLAKSETLTVLEGEADALVFGDQGLLDRVIPMGACGSGRTFFYRMPSGVFHGLAFRSDWLVFLETTTGPFDPAASEPAPWAPPEEDQAAGRAFIAAATGSGRPI